MPTSGQVRAASSAFPVGSGLSRRRLADFLRLSRRPRAAGPGESFPAGESPATAEPGVAAMTIATTTDGLARTARFVAFPDAAPVLLAPVVLTDVDDLHDADFDLVLADQLADAYDAADMAN